MTDHDAHVVDHVTSYTTFSRILLLATYYYFYYQVKCQSRT